MSKISLIPNIEEVKIIWNIQTLNERNMKNKKNFQVLGGLGIL